jgi:hypothetical protein
MNKGKKIVNILCIVTQLYSYTVTHTYKRKRIYINSYIHIHIILIITFNTRVHRAVGVSW